MKMKFFTTILFSLLLQFSSFGTEVDSTKFPYNCYIGPFVGGCDFPERYDCPIFLGKVEATPNIPYAKFKSHQFWGSLLTLPYCFFNRVGAFDTLSATDYRLLVDLYKPKNNFDTCKNRACIILLHGGGYDPYSFENRRTEAQLYLANYFAERGFVVFSMAYRTGWDVGSSNLIPPGDTLYDKCIAGFPFTTQGNDFSFVEATYRNVQDLRALHRFILAQNEENFDSLNLNIDPNKIFYVGMSTGGIIAITTAFGRNEMANMRNPETNFKIKDQFGFGDVDEFGQYQAYKNKIKVAGVMASAGAIYKTDWMDYDGDDENIPILLSHGSLDTLVFYDYGPIGRITKYNNNNDPKYFKLYGGRGIYDYAKSKYDGNENGPPVHLYTYQCTGHGVGLLPFFDKDTNFIFPPSLGTKFVREVLSGETLQNKHTYILNSFYYKESYTKDADTDGDDWACEEGIYILPADSSIKPADTILVNDTSYTVIDSVFIDNVWIYTFDTIYGIDTFFVAADTFIKPADTFNILYTPRSVTTTNEHFKTDALKLFPNPNKGSFQIELKEALEEKAEIYVYDIIGNLIYRNEMSPGERFRQINMDHLSKGVYILQLHMVSGKSVALKFLVQ